MSGEETVRVGPQRNRLRVEALGVAGHQLHDDPGEACELVGDPSREAARAVAVAGLAGDLAGDPAGSRLEIDIPSLMVNRSWAEIWTRSAPMQSEIIENHRFSIESSYFME